jgi:hypothetical protein
MEPARDLQRIERMFASGQPFLVDAQSGYRYSMVACCPQDGSYSSVAQIEKQGQALSRVVFQCPVCFNQFEAKREEIYVC